MAIYPSGMYKRATPKFNTNYSSNKTHLSATAFHKVKLKLMLLSRHIFALKFMHGVAPCTNSSIPAPCLRPFSVFPLYT